MKLPIPMRNRIFRLTGASTEFFTYFGCTRLLVHSLLEMEKQALLPHEATSRWKIWAAASRILIQAFDRSCDFCQSGLAKVKKVGERTMDVGLLMLMLTLTSDFQKSTRALRVPMSSKADTCNDDNNERSECYNDCRNNCRNEKNCNGCWLIYCCCLYDMMHHAAEELLLILTIGYEVT